MDDNIKADLKTHLQASVELLMPDEAAVGDREGYEIGSLDRSIAIQMERIMEDLYFLIDTLEGRTRTVTEDRPLMSTFDEPPKSTEPE